jgi:hypothetical protein
MNQIQKTKLDEEVGRFVASRFHAVIKTPQPGPG